MRVLYYCVENSCRSQMAEALTSLLSMEGVEAYSAGSAPSVKVDERAVEVMRELGYDMTGHVPKSLDEVPELEFDYAVTLGCNDECPMVKARMHMDWDIPDPEGLGRTEMIVVRDMIRERVQRLLAAPRSMAD